MTNGVALLCPTLLVVLAAGGLVAADKRCGDDWFGGCPDEQCFQEYRTLVTINDPSKRGEELRRWRTKCDKKPDEQTTPAPAQNSQANQRTAVEARTSPPKTTREAGEDEAATKTSPTSAHSGTPPSVVGGWVWGSPAEIVGCTRTTGDQLRHFVCQAQPPGFCPTDIASRCKQLSEVPLSSLVEQQSTPVRFVDVSLLPTNACAPFLFCGESLDTGRALFALQGEEGGIRILRSRPGQQGQINTTTIARNLLRYEHEIAATQRPTVPSAWDVRAYLLRKILGNDPEAKIIQGTDGDTPLEHQLCAVLSVGMRDDLYCFSRLTGARPLVMNHLEPGTEERFLAGVRKSGPSNALKRALEEANAEIQIQLAREEGLFGTAGNEATVWKESKAQRVPTRTTSRLKTLVSEESKPLLVSLMERLIGNPALLVLETDGRDGACTMTTENTVSCFLMNGTTWAPLAKDFPQRDEFTEWYRQSSGVFDDSVPNHFLQTSIGHRSYLHRAFGDAGDSGALLGISDQETLSWTSGCETTLTLFGKSGAKKQPTRFALLEADGDCDKALAEAEQRYRSVIASFVLAEQPTEVESFQFGAGRMAVSYVKSGESQLRLWITPDQALSAVSMASITGCAGLPLGPGKTQPNTETLVRGLLTTNWRKEWKANPLGLIIRAQKGCR